MIVVTHGAVLCRAFSYFLLLTTMTKRKTTPPAKKKYQVRAEYTEYYFLDVDAASESEAFKIGVNSDRADFTHEDDEWYIAYAEECEPLIEAPQEPKPSDS